MPKKLNSLTGVAGEYYVCAELAKRGYVAVLAPKNNPLFDLVVMNQEGTHSVSIQVKTRSSDNKQGWKLGKDIEHKHENSELFVVLVALKEEGYPDFYIYPHDELSGRVAGQYEEYISEVKRDGKPRKDVGFRWHDLKYFTDYDHSRKNDWILLTKLLN
ncbi:MAG: aspartate-ammonia lyase [Pirellulales bacterium]|nr:aspartate-ammonia lyase [Pirellulales bacterium]